MDEKTEINFDICRRLFSQYARVYCLYTDWEQIKRKYGEKKDNDCVFYTQKAKERPKKRQQQQHQ